MFYLIRKRLFISLLAATLLFINGCNLFGSNGKSNRVEKLHEKFHGTWQPVYALSELPIDGDLDGESSSYMLEELTNFQNGFLDIHIRKDRLQEGEYPYLISVPYPVQYFPSESSLGDTNFYINYMINYADWKFKFGPERKQLLLHEDQSSPIDRETYPRPESIEIKNNGLLIVVVIEKELLTAEGWQTVTIRTRYARTSEYN